MYCRVIVDIVHENVAKPFTYLIPEGTVLTPGQRVAVPFGNREKEGIVTALTEECDIAPEKVKAVLYPLEDYAAIPPELMALAQEMAVQAHCPPAETLRLMLPAQMRGGRIRVKTIRMVRLAVSEETARQAAQEDRRGGKRAKILEILACGEPNVIGWDILRNHAAGFAACPDWMSAKGMRMYGVPLAGDPVIISGESGAVTMGFLASVMMYPRYEEIREALKLDENSVVLLISTEGNTDPVRFREVVWDGLYGIRQRGEEVIK